MRFRVTLLYLRTNKILSVDSQTLNVWYKSVGVTLCVLLNQQPLK